MKKMMILALAGALIGACGDDDTTTTVDTAMPNADGMMMMEKPVFFDFTPNDGDTLEFSGDWSTNNKLGVDAKLLDPTNLDAPNFKPAADSPVASGISTPAGFEKADYAGAIDPAGDDWTAGWTFADAGALPTGKESVSVSADITTDTTWTADKEYSLDAQIYVVGATLTIEAGTVIKGSAGANALIVTTTGKLIAEGTKDAPIVFTSSKDVGAQLPGDWGGLVLLGNAPINVEGGTNLIEGLSPGESRGNYGGNDAAHNCGSLKYVRIEYAGFTFGTDNELNGLTLGGCGSETSMDYIQVHLGKDDGIEFFGGNANLRHALVTHVGDDSLDWDQGYSGKVQFFIAQQDAVGDRTIEADNLKANNDAMPRSNPTLANITLIGADGAKQQAMRLRRGTAAQIHNAIVMGFSKNECIRVDNTATIQQANMGALNISGAFISGCGSK